MREGGLDLTEQKASTFRIRYTKESTLEENVCLDHL
jgi:hypothetical protein